MIRALALATFIAGTLDIVFAFVVADAVAPVLRTVASGPLGDPIADSAAGPALGLVVHFAIMALMAAAWFLAASRLPLLGRQWFVAGLLYGAALWIVMYWIVMPLRWEGYHTPQGAVPIARQLFAHCILVGLPIAWFARRQVAIRQSFN